jgi:release factor glutamine methyltransferase
MAWRRLAGEPMTRILGRREFWGLSFAVTSAVLDPRSDTETLVEAALRALSARRNAPLRLLDLGTGSGALLCALLTELPNAIGLGVDLSPAAAEVASANLHALDLAARGAIVVGDWTSAAAPGFDLIVSNPPYIATADIAGLDAEVRLHDPHLALDGGESGLDAYRALAKTIGAALASQGVICVEAGAGQANAISEIFAAQGFVTVAMDNDLGGHARCLTLRAQ